VKTASHYKVIAVTGADAKAEPSKPAQVIVKSCLGRADDA